MLHDEQVLDGAVNALIQTVGDYNAVFDASFAACGEAGELYYTLAVDAELDSMFVENIFATYQNAPRLSDFMYSLLHELGHLENYGVEEDDRECRDVLMVPSDTMTVRERYAEYLQLPNEVAATDWAVQYATENYDVLEKWWNEVWTPAMRQFMDVNGIELDEKCA